MWPLNTFFRLMRNRSNAEYVTIWLSSDCPHSHLPLGCTDTEGMECIPGSAMYLICRQQLTPQFRLSYTLLNMMCACEGHVQRRAAERLHRACAPGASVPAEQGAQPATSPHT